MSRRPVVVIGAGLVGSVLSTYLARRGLDVIVYEKQPDVRLMRDVGHRPSINVTLCARGLHALAGAGVLHAVEPLLARAYGRVVHVEGRDVSYQPYGRAHDAIYSVNRNRLNAVLLDEAERAGVEFRFCSRCSDIDETALRVSFDGAGNRHVADVACIIAVDGASSTVRKRLVERHAVCESATHAGTGYRTFTIAADAGAALRQDSVHVWPRQERMGLAFPNVDGSYSVAIHLPLAEESPSERRCDLDVTCELLERLFPDMPARASDVTHSFRAQRPNTMLTVRSAPWSVGAGILLMGDAAHAILPHYGQGANAGFEDCRLLDALIEDEGTNWDAVFGIFEQQRRADAEALAELCSEQAHRLHYSVGTEEFERALLVERWLSEICPERIIPLYSMMAFSQLRYSAIAMRERRQRRLIDELLAVSRVEDRFGDPQLTREVRMRIERDVPVVEGAVQ